MTRLENIRLSFGTTKDPDTYGFHRTAEGRKALRDLFPDLLERTPFGVRKIASIVAIKKTKSEIESTRSALKRWAAGKDELWEKDTSRSLAVMRNLEHQMLEVSDIAEVLSDIAATVAKRSVAEGLSTFFYGMRREEDELEMITAALRNSSGLFRQYFVVEPGSSGASNIDVWLRLYHPPDSMFLLAKQFFLDRIEDDGRLRIRGRWSGFAFPAPDGNIQLFLINHAQPKRRTYEELAFKGKGTASVDDSSQPKAVTGKQYEVLRRPFFNTSMYRERPVTRRKRILVEAKDQRSLFIKKSIDRHMWDVII